MVQVPVFEAVCNNRVSAALNVNGCSVGIDATNNVLYSYSRISLTKKSADREQILESRVSKAQQAGITPK